MICCPIEVRCASKAIHWKRIWQINSSWAYRTLSNTCEPITTDRKCDSLFESCGFHQFIVSQPVATQEHWWNWTVDRHRPRMKRGKHESCCAWKRNEMLELELSNKILNKSMVQKHASFYWFIIVKIFIVHLVVQFFLLLLKVCKQDLASFWIAEELDAVNFNWSFTPSTLVFRCGLNLQNIILAKTAYIRVFLFSETNQQKELFFTLFQHFPSMFQVLLLMLL